ncbi:MerP protein [marine bacterium AO1-C]|nr:MerP protein [marine bacterium AO1-C]
MRMKKLFLLGMLCLIGFSFQAQAQKKKNKKVATIEIKTSSQCEMCKERIEKAMAYEKGIKSAVLNVESKILTVTYKTRKTNPDKIRKAVSKVGYDADEVPAWKKAYDKLPACCQKGGHDGGKMKMKKN